MRPTAHHSLAARIGCLISVLLLLFSFFYPKRLAASLQQQFCAHMQMAEKSLYAEDWDGLQTAVEELNRLLSVYEPRLRLFFHHQDVDELSTLAAEALCLSYRKNDELLSRLVGVERIAEHLLESESFSLSNLF